MTTARPRLLSGLLCVALTAVLLTACSGDGDDTASPPRMAAPCSLVAGTDITAAFPTGAVSELSETERECRYSVGSDTLRVVVLADDATATGIERSYAAMGRTLTRVPDIPGKAYVSDRNDEVIVVGDDVTFALTFSRAGADVVLGLTEIATGWVTAAAE